MKETLVAILLFLFGNKFNRRKREECVGNDRRRIGYRASQKKLIDSIDRLSDAVDKTIGGKS